MFSKRLLKKFIIIASIVVLPYFQTTGQIKMTAKHLIKVADSIAITYANNMYLIGVYATNTNIDTNGYADKWLYRYYSIDSTDIWNSKEYYFIGQNNQIMFYNSYRVGADSAHVAKRWMDSDSALLIAQRVKGSDLSKQFPTYTVSAQLMPETYPQLHTIWQINYWCDDDSTRSVKIDANTGEIIRVWVETGVNDSKDKLLPIHFELYQNFPNPFNPITNFSFYISSRSYVSLKIYDVLSREVVSLISEDLLAGNHSIKWDASNYSSGIYFYRLQVGYYSQIKKLVFLK